MIARAVRGAGGLARYVSSTLRKIYFRSAYNVRFGADVTVSRGVSIKVFDGGSVDIGAGTHIAPNAIIEAKAAPISIGARSLINTGVFIAASFGISIGDDALIAEYVTIRDADHGYDDASIPFNRQLQRGARVVIGDNVWLGAKVTVTQGVTIGPRSIVGANSVVTRSLDGGGKYVGAPARRIGLV